MVSRLISRECWLETTMVSIRVGRSSSSYSMVTWVLPSGRRYGTRPSLRTSVNCSARRCANEIGSGMSSRVSVQAYPNINPWSPAPWRSRGSPLPPSRSSIASSTPWAMSGDCLPIDTEMPQDSPSKPFVEESYPIPSTVSRTKRITSAKPSVVTSPATCT